MELQLVRSEISSPHEIACCEKFIRDARGWNFGVSSGAIIVSELRPKVLESYRARQGAAAGPAAVDNAISQSLTHASTFIEHDRGPRTRRGRPACVHLPLSRNLYVAAALLRMHRGAAKISHSAKNSDARTPFLLFSLSLYVRAP